MGLPPVIIHLNRIAPYKPIHFEYPHLWNPGIFLICFMILPQISCPTVPESARLHSLNGGCQNGKVGARVIHCHPLDCQAHPWNPLGRHFTKSKEVQVDSKEIGLENCRVW